jgi:hypothetical protein
MSLPSSTPTTIPSPIQLYVANHRSAILTTTLVAHVAHWSYLTRFRRMNPSLKANRGQFGKLGLGWAVVYVGVLGAITISVRDVQNSGDPLLRGRFP